MGATAEDRIEFEFFLRDIEEIKDFPKTGICASITYIRPKQYIKSEKDKDLRQSKHLIFSELISWFVQHFGHFSREQAKDVEGMVAHIVSYAVHTFPGAKSHDVLLLHAMLHMWWWIVDDWIDTSGATPLKIQALKDIVQEFTNPKKDFTDRVLQSVCSAYSDFLVKVRNLIPNFDKISSRFHVLIRKHFETLEWSFMSGAVQTHSDSTYRHWRVLESGLAPTYEFLGLVDGLKLNEEIRNHPLFKQMCYVSQNIGTNVNDILGLKKDAISGDNDSWLIYKLRRGQNVKFAIQDVITNTNQLVEDFVKLKALVCKKFESSDGLPDLKRFIDLIESHEFGSFQVFTSSQRYLMAGSVYLIDKRGVNVKQQQLEK